MHREIIDKIKPECEKAIDFLDRELRKIRTGRASAALIEDISVECFGQRFPLRQLATISVPEPRQILIQPWDKSYIEGISKALGGSNIGTIPVVEGNLIRINLPPLSEEYRENLIKLISEKQESTRKTIRHWREVAWDEIQEKFKEGKVREDDKFRAKEELQDLVDEYNGKIKEMGKVKIKEMME